MKIFDLTPAEVRTLLRVGQAIGIHTELDLLEIARRHKISSGSRLINFVFAASVMPWLLEEIA